MASGAFRRLQCARRFSISTSADKEGNAVLSRWLQEWTAVPRVVFTDDTEPPTAISWLRQHGPPLPEAALHRLFRQQTVRLYDPSTHKVVRANKSRALPPGALLLLPKTEVAAGGTNGSQSSGSSTSEADEGAQHAQQQGQHAQQAQHAQQQQAASPARARAAQRWLSELRSGLLAHTPDFLALNKPAGLACQGGVGVAVSLDGLMGEAWGHLPGVQAAQLRLVHRMDRQTTGALLVAKSPDAAAWLSAAFKEGSLSSSSSSSSIGGRGGRSSSRAGSRGVARGAAAAAAPDSIRKTYWAVVARDQNDKLEGSSRGSGRVSSGAGEGWLPPTGSIRLAVPSSRDPASLLPAETRYRVLHQGPSLAWLQLQPLTGRKHQLRLHCARGLGAAVLGDSRYAVLRSGPQQAALAALRQAPGSSSSGNDSTAPLFLHCRRLVVQRAGGGGNRGAAVEVTAPLPAVWADLLMQQGWPLPAGESA